MNPPQTIPPPSILFHPNTTTADCQQYLALDPTTRSPLSFSTVLDSLASSSSSSTTTTTHLLHTLQTCPFPAAFWEFPPLSSSILAKKEDVPFEFVLVNAPALASPSFRADPQPFADYLERGGEGDICVFANLGKDATLVVPTFTAENLCADDDDDSVDSKKEESIDSMSMNEYAHLLSFLRGPHVPEAQKLRLLQRVAQVTLDKCHENEQQEEREKLVWLSTSGLGVSWLHVRVEDRPKYYTHQDYVRRRGVGRSGGRGGMGNEGSRKSGKRY